MEHYPWCDCGCSVSVSYGKEDGGGSLIVPQWARGAGVDSLPLAGRNGSQHQLGV
jgi:hypothetical protein